MCRLAYEPAIPGSSGTTLVVAPLPANASGGDVYPREVTIYLTVAGIAPRGLLQLLGVVCGAIEPILSWLDGPGWAR